MTHRLKTLTLLFLLSLALSAAAASTASGTAKVTTVNGEYPAVLTGSQEGPITENYFETTPGMKFHCATATGEATLSEASTTVLVTPHLTECKATSPGLELNLSFHLNGCQFQVSAGATTSPTETHGSVKVTCPAGKKITVTVATCQVHVVPQEIPGTVALTNLANGKVTIETNISGKLHYEETDGFLCPFSGNTTGTNGSVRGNVLITGYNDEGTVESPATKEIFNHKHSPTERAIHVK